VSGAKELVIKYDDGRPFFSIPESDLQMSVWNTSGQLLFDGPGGFEDRVVSISDLTNTAGVLIVTLAGDEGVYVGKAIVGE
jgi:hypothetical protein